MFNDKQLVLLRNTLLDYKDICEDEGLPITGRVTQGILDVVVNEILKRGYHV